MLKAIVGSLLIGFTSLSAIGASVDWSINLGPHHAGHEYFVLDDSTIYDVQFGLMTSIYGVDDYANISMIHGYLDNVGKAKFSVNEKNYLYVLVNVGGNNYTWTQPTWSMVGRDLTVSDFGVDRLPGEFYNLGGSRGDGFGEAVPEPNSGLLIILGMALLSLKRKSINN